jgi:single-stranded-DNA-specific exonuclease
MAKDWTFFSREETKARDIADRLRIHPITAHALINRGVTDTESARAFLNPSLAGLRDAFSLKDMQKAVSRIASAIRDRERILVFGDFDADGITGTSILYLFLKRSGADVRYHVPRRIEDGYGLRSDIIEKYRECPFDLLISIDNGIGSAEAVARIQAEKIDVIITDHHEPGAEIPNAYAVVNPKQEDCGYGYRDLTGAGIAFKLACAIAEGYSPGMKGSGDLRELLNDLIGLAAIGTISDVAPLIGENRIIAHYGLLALERSANPGIRALLSVAGLEEGAIKAQDVGFKIGPRLNASGRMGDAALAVQLLTSESYAEALALGERLDRMNQDRQETERSIVERCRARISSDPSIAREPVIVLWDESWHPGVIGIVASKLCEEYSRPVVLVAIRGERARGSCRSVAGAPILDLLRACEDLCASLGGHTFAAGFEIETDRLPAFRDRLLTRAREAMGKNSGRARLSIDLETAIGALTPELVSDLERLHPHGEGNPVPLFAVRGARVVGEPRAVGRGGAHLSFILRQGDHSIRAIAFRMGPEIESLREGRPISVAFTPFRSRWRDSDALEIDVKDFLVDS